MKFNVEIVMCYKESKVNYASNSETGVYKFKLNVEDNIEIDCQFSATYMNPDTPISKDCIQGSLKCESHCTTIGGPDSNKACVFPFVWKGRNYGECTDIDHPSGQDTSELYCATEIDLTTKQMKSWGKCSRTCGYCYGSDVTRKKNGYWWKHVVDCNEVRKMINFPGKKSYKTWQYKTIIWSYTFFNYVLKIINYGLKKYFFWDKHHKQVWRPNCHQK